MKRRSLQGPAVVLILLGFGASFVGIAPAPRSAHETTGNVTIGSTAPTLVTRVPDGRSGVPDSRSEERRAASAATIPSIRPRPTQAPAKASPRPTNAPHAPIRPQVTAYATARPQTALGPVLRGSATYYGTGGPGEYAAMGGYQDGTRVIVQVCTFLDSRARCITVPVVTQCAACRWAAGQTLVDLSIPAWLAIAGGRSLSRGVLPVMVTILEGSVG